MSGALARRGLGWVIDALLPPRCLSCEAPVEAQGTQCAACFGSLNFLAEPFCRCCAVPFGAAEEATAEGLCAACAAEPPDFLVARAALIYDAGARRLILPFKHAGRVEMATPLAGHMLRAGRVLLDHAELLVPVPPHRWRLFGRGYDQAALLARALSRRSGKPWAPRALRRRQATRSLGPLGAAARAAVVAGAFDVPRPDGVAGRHVLLVDDVMTSGATASACARALLAAGAAGVMVLAAARVPDPRAEAGS